MTFNVLTNKYVFYTLLFIAVASLLGYLEMGDYESLTLFVIIYALSTYFSKNTIVTLSIAIVGTALVRTPLRRRWLWREREGFEEGARNIEGGTTALAPRSLPERAREGIRHGAETVKNAGEAIHLSEADAFAPSREDDDEDKAASAADEGEEDEVTGGRIDYAGSLEQQYDNLQNVLGGDGIKALTKDTTHLVETQQNLMEQMASMGPLMENAQKLLSSFEDSGMMKLVDKVIPLVEKIALPGQSGGKKKKA